MKNFLAVDTSGNHLAVVAVKDGNPASVYIENCAMKHAVSVMGAIDEVLAKNQSFLEDYDFFAAVVGAGSFTGIRIGISTVKGFCLATGKPALPITSFDVAAYNAVDAQEKVLCLVDALHDFYYACGYEKGEIVYPPAYLSKDEVLALAGQGYALRALAPLPLSAEAEVKIVDPVIGLENAARKKAEQGGFKELTALYVRKSSAEINLEK